MLTNEPFNRVQTRFERDGLVHLLPNVRSPFEGKSKELYDLATQKDKPFIYIGDLVSDGESCMEARNKGARNILFYGIVHPYAMNSPRAIKAFVSKNSDFAKVLNRLEDIDVIWNQ